MNFNMHKIYFTGIKWSTLKTILDNKIVASTYIWIILLPIIMNATSKFPESIEIFPWGSIQPINIALEIPINWYSIYFSALIFSLARIIYVYKCPDFLRNYSSASDATSKGITAEIVWDKICDHIRLHYARNIKESSDEARAIIKILQVLEGRDNKINADIQKRSSFSYISKKYYVTDKPGTGLFTFIDGSDPNFSLSATRSADRSSNLLIWRFIELQDLYSPSYRLITTILTSIGALLLLIPVAQGFYHVLTQFFITFFAP